MQVGSHRVEADLVRAYPDAVWAVRPYRGLLLVFFFQHGRHTVQGLACTPDTADLQIIHDTCQEESRV